MDVLPAAGRVAWWGTAWMRGLIGPDELLDGVLGAADGVAPQGRGGRPADVALERDTAHVVLGETGPESLVLELAAARNRGARAVGAAFPAPGDPVGLRGPRHFTAAAIDAGQAVVLLGAGPAQGLGLVPQQVGRAVEWTAYPVDRRPPLDVGDADRALRTAVLAAAQALADLDVARWRPEVADELHDLRAGVPLAAPAGTPPRCVTLAGRALHLAAVVELALADDGGAVTVAEAAARRAALEPLERTARHALTAACSPDGWPPHRDDGPER